MLIQTGCWYWRENEISLADFRKLTKQEKLQHIEFLKQLPQQELSTNDRYVLNDYGYKMETKKFLEL
jgi:hypothetical protein